MRRTGVAALAALTLGLAQSLALTAPAAAQDWHGRDFRQWQGDGRDWRRDDRRDWRWDGPRYRSAYAYPGGQIYRPAGLGYVLPPRFAARRYWVRDWGYYRLPRPWQGTRWVRVGPDALLIRGDSGIVLRAVRDLWW